jgi:hypothetical protein
LDSKRFLFKNIKTHEALDTEPFEEATARLDTLRIIQTPKARAIAFYIFLDGILLPFDLASSNSPVNSNR